MKFAIMRCCTTPVFLGQYETSTNAVLRAFGVDYTDPAEFNCCGYPLRNINAEAYILASARNLAVAGRLGREIVTFCNCCYGTLKHVHRLLSENGAVRERANRTLGKEGLRFDGPVGIHHILQLLHRRIGLQSVRERVVRPFQGLRLAVHYGCHLLRPQGVLGGESPFVPTLFDELVEATGAESVAWNTKLDCCGAPVRGINDDLSARLMGRKEEGAREAGADAFCVACSYCQLQFDRARRMDQGKRVEGAALPSILYTQLLGLAMGMDERELGLDRNEIRAAGIRGFLSNAPDQAGMEVPAAP